MSSPSNGYSLAFIRFWVLLGVILFAGMIISPYFLNRIMESERVRFEACQKGQRGDCLSSFAWVKNGWQLRDYGVRSSDLVNTDLVVTSTESGEKRQFDLGSVDETVRVVATSRDKAPTIISVKPQGMDLVSHRYLAAPGTTVKVLAQIANAQTVDLWLIKREPSGTPFPSKIAAMKKTADQTYEAEFKLAQDFFGEIEIRTTGTTPGESASIFVNIGATN